MYEGHVPLELCPKCSGPLDTVIDEVSLREQPRPELGKASPTMWRFQSFLPVKKGDRVVSAGEGGTPLRTIKTYSGKVWVKDETRNPTGTFKDRGASLAITCLSQLGVRKVVVASEGNAGCSFALYSHMARIKCHVFLPDLANDAKVLLTKKLGASVSRVHGTIADAGRKAAAASRKTKSYNASTFVTPFRHDGKGTMALEICEQSGWKAPDWIVYPIGGGVGLVGMWKMFKILYRIGWIDHKPRFVGVQPTGCAPVVKAYKDRKTDVEKWKDPKTLALGLRIPKPLAGRWILKSLQESKGLAVAVSDRQIRTTMKTLAAKEGLLTEPSGSAAFAVLPQLYEDRLIDRTEEVIVIGTGSALKTLDDL